MTGGLCKCQVKREMQAKCMHSRSDARSGRRVQVSDFSMAGSPLILRRSAGRPVDLRRAAAQADPVQRRRCNATERLSPNEIQKERHLRTISSSAFFSLTCVSDRRVKQAGELGFEREKRTFCLQGACKEVARKCVAKEPVRANVHGHCRESARDLDGQNCGKIVAKATGAIGPLVKSDDQLVSCHFFAAILPQRFFGKFHFATFLPHYCHNFATRGFLGAFLTAALLPPCSPATPVAPFRLRVP